MKLSKLTLRNFQCFGPTKTIINLENNTIFIGNNSTGKTATLLGLLKLFGKGQQREIIRDDFHTPHNVDPNSIVSADLLIEAKIEFPELGTDDADHSSIPVFFQHMVVNNQGESPYVRLRLESHWEQGLTPDGIVNSEFFFITCPEGGESDEVSEDNKTRVDLAELQESVQYIYVPAVRNPDSQLKNVTGTFLYRLYKSIKWGDEFTDQMKVQTKNLDDLFQEQPGVKIIAKLMNDNWKEYYGNKKYGKTKINFSPKDLSSLINKIDIEFHPTDTPGSYTASKLGDGTRSLFYLSLMKTLIDIEDLVRQGADGVENLISTVPPTFTFIALEEPENHVAPHLLGKILENIDSLSKKNTIQVILTTHSPSSVKRVSPKNIRHFRLIETTQSSVVSEIKLPVDSDDANKYVKEAVQAFPELYFSNFVVLGEGDSEMIIFPKIIELENGKADRFSASITPLGGRHVNHFWRLFKDLNIPYLTLLDIDSEREGGGWHRIKYAMEQLLQNGTQIEEFKKDDGNSLTQEELDAFSSKDLAQCNAEMEYWISFLEKFGVFFSRPLDLDFMMLESFTEHYKNSVLSGYGPNLPDKTTNRDEYDKRIKSAIRSCLKKAGGNGDTYSQDQKELMVWYQYFFLNRGKPTTHISALSKIPDTELKSNMPIVFKSLLKYLQEKLKSNDSEH